MRQNFLNLIGNTSQKDRIFFELAEQNPGCIMVTNPDGVILYVNQQFEKITGYSSEEVLGENPRFLQSGINTPEMYQDMWRVITSGKTWEGEFCNKKKNGELYWEFERISSIVDPDGQITHFIAVKNDITLRKLAEKNLRESEEHFRSMAQSANDSIITMDEAGLIIGWNRASEKIFGHLTEEVLGKSIALIVPERCKSDFTTNIFFGTKEVQGLHRNGYEISLELSLSTWVTGAGKFFTGIFRDITERKKIENSLRVLGITDDLTKLYNRRFFNQQLEIEIERARRYGQPLTVLFTDVDNFKNYNDTHGHLDGDQVLIRLALVMQLRMRKSDFVCRFGGEEFAIILPMKDLKSGVIVAENIRRGFSEEVITTTSGQKTQLTLSVGVAQYNNPEPIDVFIARADALMYEAKTSGKNRVCPNTA